MLIHIYHLLAAFHIEMISLLALTVAALALEHQVPQRLDVLVSKKRQAPSQGLALGTLIIPWVTSALSAKYARQGTPTSAAKCSIKCLHHSLASSVYILASLCITAWVTAPAEEPEEKKRSFTARRWEKMRMKKLTTLLQRGLLHGILSSVLAVINGPFCIFTGVAYGRFVKYVHNTFTLGESIVVVQGIGLVAQILFLECTIDRHMVLSWHSLFTATVLLAAVALGLVFATVLMLRENVNTTIHSSILVVIPLFVAMYAYEPIVQDLLINFIYSEVQRIQVVTCWAVLLAVTLPSMLLLSRSGRIPNIILRKGYHVLAVALFLPALLTQPQLLGIALACAFAVLVAVEVLRTGNIPGVSQYIDNFMGSFVDERDAGVVYVTHFTLLLGMALPVWLSIATMKENYSHDNSNKLLSSSNIWPAALAGILAIGLGDAAASIVGSRFGRVQIAPKSRKTLEGTLAGAGVVILAWVGLAYYQFIPEMQSIFDDSSSGSINWVVLGAVTLLNSLLEAATEQLDNLFVPLHYFALLICLFK